MIRKLSEKLKVMRTDRPDEWTMDEFMRDAVKLEKERDDALAKLAVMESQEQVGVALEEVADYGSHSVDFTARVELGQPLYAKPVSATRPAPCEHRCEAKAFEIEIRQLKAQLETAGKPAVAVPIDWKLVPVFPTPEMIHRGAIARQMPSAGTGDIWDAMLAAAPSHSQQSSITDSDRLNYLAESRTLIHKTKQNDYFLVYRDGETSYDDDDFRKLIDQNMIDRCPSHESEQGGAV